MKTLKEVEKKFNKVASKASLKNSNTVEFRNMMVYKIPTEWIEILKNNGFSFSTYAKLAIQEKMKRDGLL
jgi:hypothetical protein